MNKDELLTARNQVESEFNNLSNHKWVSSQLDYLKGKYDTLSELINKENQNATSRSTKRQANSIDNKGK